MSDFLEVARLIESPALLAFASAVLFDLRLLRKAYEGQTVKVAVIESRQVDVLSERSGPVFARPQTQTQ